MKTTGIKWLLKEKKVKPKIYCVPCLERGKSVEIPRGKYCLDCKVKVWVEHNTKMSAKRYHKNHEIR